MLRRLISALCAVFLVASPALSCTDIRIKPSDGTTLSVRTMDFGLALDSELVVSPRGQSVVSPAPGGGQGLAWTAKYGSVYMNAAGRPFAVDGLNEAGLGVGSLYLPGETEYQTIAAGEEARALSNAFFASWVLDNFSTVKEVRAALADVLVWGEEIPQLGSFAPLHYVVHDATGQSIVVEYVGGDMRVHDHQVGVLTNSPTYEWHLQNLRNYVNLTSVQVPLAKLGKVTYAATGQGSGLHGLPGDPTPPSRFVMAAAGLYLSDKPANAAEALILAHHLSNRVDVPKGFVRDYSAGGTPQEDHTLWTVFRDHSNRIYYWRTYSDPALRGIDLKTLDFSAGQPLRRAALGNAQPTVHLLKAEDLTAMPQ